MIDLLFMPYSFNPAIEILKREERYIEGVGVQGATDGIRQVVI